jgi:hypothetical protein
VAAAAADLGAADLGAADLGAADLGAADLGAADLGAADLGAADLGADFSSAGFEAGTGSATGSGASGEGLRLRGGLALVSSLGEQNIKSREPAGLTWRNSPSATSPTDTTLAEPPTATPTATGVNHTVDCLPADSSSRMAATSDSDSERTATIDNPSSNPGVNGHCAWPRAQR